jgi:hypothetical protein
MQYAAGYLVAEEDDDDDVDVLTCYDRGLSF